MSQTLLTRNKFTVDFLFFVGTLFCDSIVLFLIVIISNCKCLFNFIYVVNCCQFSRFYPGINAFCLIRTYSTQGYKEFCIILCILHNGKKGFTAIILRDPIYPSIASSSLHLMIVVLLLLIFYIVSTHIHKNGTNKLTCSLVRCNCTYLLGSLLES